MANTARILACLWLAFLYSVIGGNASDITLPPEMFSTLKDGSFFRPEGLDINEDCKSHVAAYNERLPWHFGKDMDDFWAAKSKETNLKKKKE